MNWNNDIHKLLKCVQDTYRKEGINNSNCEIIFSDYFKIFNLVLVDLYKTIVTEIDDGDEILSYVKETFSFKDSKGKIQKKKTFNDITTGPKIQVFNKYKMLSLLDKSKFDSEELIKLFQKIDTYYLPLRNKGLEHIESAPTGMVRAKTIISKDQVIEAASVFDKFFTRLNIIVGPNLVQVVENLPKQDCIEFIGRKNIKKEILGYIKNENVKVVSITGFGGYGKTELMKQIAFEIKESDYSFDAILWISFKRDKYIVDEDKIDPLKENDNFRSLEDIFNLILDKVSSEHYEDISSYTKEIKKNKVIRIFKEKKILLLLDNYETIINEDKEIKHFVEKTENIPLNLKILLSCRHEVLPFKVKNVRLDSFSKNEIKDYLHNYFKIAGRDFDLSDKFIEKIRKRSYGHPFALQVITNWIIDGKIDESNIDLILTALDSTKIGDFCFKHDYESLFQKTKHLLCIACSKYDINKDELRRLSKIIIGLNDNEFVIEINKLAKLNYLLNPTNPEKIFIPDMVKYYVRQILPNEYLEHGKSKVSLATRIGQEWKKIKENKPEITDWDDLSKDISFFLNKPQKQDDKIYYELINKLNRLEEYKKKESIFYYYRSKIKKLIIGEEKEALKDIKTALKIDEEIPEYILLYSQILFDLGEHKIARETVEKFLDNSQRPNPDIFLAMLDFYHNYDDFERVFYKFFNYNYNFDSISIKMKLIKKSLFTIYNYIKNGVQTIPKDKLIKIYKHLELIYNYMELNEDKIFNYVFIINLEHIIKSLREIRRGFFGDYDSNYYNEINEYANLIQNRYSKKYKLFDKEEKVCKIENE